MTYAALSKSPLDRRLRHQHETGARGNRPDSAGFLINAGMGTPMVTAIMSLGPLVATAGISMLVQAGASFSGGRKLLPAFEIAA